MRTSLTIGATLVATTALTMPLHADLVSEVVDLSGAISDGTLANPGQVTAVDIDAPANLVVINFQWAHAFEAFSPSWGSEARILIEAPNGATFTFSGLNVGWDTAPGIFFDEGSTDAFNGSPLAGTWTFTFYESFDDPISPDGVYAAAVFVISAIPSPAALPLLALGALIGTRRRRR